MHSLWHPKENRAESPGNPVSMRFPMIPCDTLGRPRAAWIKGFPGWGCHECHSRPKRLRVFSSGVQPGGGFSAGGQGRVGASPAFVFINRAFSAGELTDAESRVALAVRPLSRAILETRGDQEKLLAMVIALEALLTKRGKTMALARECRLVRLSGTEPVRCADCSQARSMASRSSWSRSRTLISGILSRSRSWRKAASKSSSAVRYCLTPQTPGTYQRASRRGARSASPGTSMNPSRCDAWRRYRPTSWHWDKRRKGY